MAVALLLLCGHMPGFAPEAYSSGCYIVKLRNCNTVMHSWRFVARGNGQHLELSIKGLVCGLIQHLM
jgi:hypothetical protein